MGFWRHTNGVHEFHEGTPEKSKLKLSVKPTEKGVDVLYNHGDLPPHVKFGDDVDQYEENELGKLTPHATYRISFESGEIRVTKQGKDGKMVPAPAKEHSGLNFAITQHVTTYPNDNRNWNKDRKLLEKALSALK